MAKNKNEKASPQTEEAAMKAAMATQRPGQTKEQTKLIAHGIQKGISHYKKQHKSKSRDLNKKIHQVSKAQESLITEKNVPIQESKVQKNNLPWILLGLSWAFFIAYRVVTHVE
jgi:hypothetical protein